MCWELCQRFWRFCVALCFWHSWKSFTASYLQLTRYCINVSSFDLFRYYYSTDEQTALYSLPVGLWSNEETANFLSIIESSTSFHSYFHRTIPHQWLRQENLLFSLVAPRGQSKLILLNLFSLAHYYGSLLIYRSILEERWPYKDYWRLRDGKNSAGSLK